MSQITRAEAARDFDRLLDRAAAGERITITGSGVPIAELVPVEQAGATDAEELLAAFARIRGRIRLGTRIAPRELIGRDDH